MHVAKFSTLLLAPLAGLAAPTRTNDVVWRTPPMAGAVLRYRQAVAPTPCAPLSPPPSDGEMKARFDRFASSFLVTKNLTEAFSYISSTYIQHRGNVPNGPEFAFQGLSRIWPNVTISNPRWTSNSTYGWLNYGVSGLGEIVDRYKFEAGCITEHWDSNEVYPTP